MIEPDEIRTHETRIYVPAWLFKLFAPKLSDDLDRRAELTGEASKQVTDVSFFGGLLGFELVVKTGEKKP